MEHLISVIWMIRVSAFGNTVILSKVMIIKPKNSYWVDSRVWVNLQSVDIISGVLEQAVVGVQHLMGQQVQPLPITQIWI